VVQVAERLRRHGAESRPVLLKRDDASIAATLQQYAVSEGADLLVMGAFSHSRIREWAFGGVTQELMGDSDHYVLLSH
jgi:nucleotide-binding universal stress UspA family protein